MESAVWAPLIGVALGVTGTILGQYLSGRTSTKQARAQRLTARRDEWRSTIREFIEEAQHAESRCVYRYNHGHPETDANNDRLWFLQKYLKITCPPEVSRAAENYAWRLDRILWEGYNQQEYDNVWDDINDHREPFIEEATKLLKIPI